MSNSASETILFESVPDGAEPAYGQVMQNTSPVGTNSDPGDMLSLQVDELDLEDPLSSEYRYYDEPLAQDKGDESARLQYTRPLPVN
ncbi:hypothetical protein N7532_003034 [Penicillium argentinense]|uniref:Uncharacterized protein n=1 Tax=Penicillium argentinense TaxID=1131581 RepID=A0A9W9FLQ8_9EURO|nr:uncharacterized protein N7532_003034 [Penicillium argentinense]KAJ5102505.1 hypothetical protein N7532_003034 [Penicillium argentinense]